MRADLPPNVLDRAWLLESEALVAAEPFFAVPPSRVTAVRDSIAGRHRYDGSAVGWWPPDRAAGRLMQTYLVGLLSAGLGDSAATARAAAVLAEPQDGVLAATARSLAHGLRAEIARRRGDWRGALAELDDFAWGPPSPSRNVAHWGARERFLKAELLQRLHRDTEALQWYASFPAGYDLPFIAAAHFRQAEIRDRLGDAERARFHRRRFVALWRESDPALRPKVDSVRALLAR